MMRLTTHHQEGRALTKVISPICQSLKDKLKVLQALAGEKPKAHL